MLHFTSCHKDTFLQYISYKRSLGYKYYNAEYFFSDFDRLLKNNNYSSIQLDKNICDIWSVKRENETDLNNYIRVNTIRCYSKYLVSLGYDSYIPNLPKYIVNYKPYIYSKQELHSFFKICDLNIFPAFSKIKYLDSALFRLLYGTGLRLSEALSLNLTDINLDQQLITVKNTKNKEERIVPFSESVLQAIKLYLNHRNMQQYNNNLFFITKRGCKISRNYIYKQFRIILLKSKISHCGKGVGPRIHDFRHTFAVHSLASMTHAGYDLYFCLAILSKYLGHNSLSATEKYLRLTIDIFPDLITQISNLTSFIYPKVGV